MWVELWADIPCTVKMMLNLFVNVSGEQITQKNVDFSGYKTWKDIGSLNGTCSANHHLVLFSIFKRKQHDPRESGGVISLAGHWQEGSEVMVISVGVDSAAWSCSAMALWNQEGAREHICSTGLHSITAPWASPRSYKVIKTWFCFTLGGPFLMISLYKRMTSEALKGTMCLACVYHNGSIAIKKKPTLVLSWIGC